MREDLPDLLDAWADERQPWDKVPEALSNASKLLREAAAEIRSLAERAEQAERLLSHALDAAVSRWHETTNDPRPLDEWLEMTVAEYHAYARGLRFYLAAAGGDPACDHEWVDARNQVVTSGELCSKCFAIRAGNQMSDNDS